MVSNALICLLFAATIFEQTPRTEQQRPDLAIVFGVKLRGQYEYISAVSKTAAGDQFGAVTVGLPEVDVNNLAFRFAIDEELCLGAEKRGISVTMTNPDAVFSIDRSQVRYLTYPADFDSNLHIIYDQIGPDSLAWANNYLPTIDWTINGPSTTITGTSTANPLVFWPQPAITYDPDKQVLANFQGARDEQLVWRGTVDGLPLDAYLYTAVTWQLIPEPPGWMLAIMGAVVLYCLPRRYLRRGI